MQNIKLTIAYDGTRYAGWQRQTGHQAAGIGQQAKKTIQEEIERALHKIFQKRIHLIGSGRTDAGVHAVGQVAHFKTEKSLPLAKLTQALNALLPEDIVVVKAEEEILDFHARYRAKLKTYRYVIVNGDVKSPFIHPWALWIKHPLDLRLMQQESRCLIGTHDFKSFQSTDKIERRSVTTIKKVTIKKHQLEGGFPFLKGIELITVDLEATGFLHNMVRNIVGTLVEVGRGRLKKGDLAKILRKKDRRHAGPCAPPHGLYLLNVRYE